MQKEIGSRYGKNYHKKRQYTTKNESAQEAHEAIRPSYIENQSVSAEPDEVRLYELIWKRTIASQMADAEIEKTIIDIINNKNKETLKAQAEVIQFDGFLKVYNESVDEDAEGDEEAEALIPPVKEGQALDLKELTATERFSKPLPRRPGVPSSGRGNLPCTCCWPTWPLPARTPKRWPGCSVRKKPRCTALFCFTARASRSRPLAC